MAEYINNRASTIYGGSAEIQRDIIAKRVLRL
jgi:acyl-CoA dehydrogenase